MNIIMYRLDLGDSAIFHCDSCSRFFYVLELLSILVLLHDDPDNLSGPCVCHFLRLQHIRDPKVEISSRATLDLLIFAARSSYHTSPSMVELP